MEKESDTMRCDAALIGFALGGGFKRSWFGLVYVTYSSYILRAYDTMSPFMCTCIMVGWLDGMIGFVFCGLQNLVGCIPVYTSRCSVRNIDR